MFLLKRILDHMRLFPAPVQVAAHGGHEFSPVGRAAFAKPVGLAILVGEFVRVKLQAVIRHPNEPQPLLALFHKAPDHTGAVHGMPVHNQIDPTRELLEQPRQELHEDRGLELVRKRHEGERPLIGDGREYGNRAPSIALWGTSREQDKLF